MSDLSKVYLSTGNFKISDCNIWNLPTGITCKSGVSCARYCYAKKAERMYENVRVRRTANYTLSQQDNFSELMTDALINKRHRTTRIHESGDFYSVKYINDWYKVAGNISDMIFYAYTKRDDLFTRTLLSERPSNFRLIRSLDGTFSNRIRFLSGLLRTGRDTGYDKYAVVINDVSDRDTGNPICQASNNHTIKCIRHCRRCTESNEDDRVVFFPKH